MAKLIVDGPDLVVRLSPLEKLGAFHGDVRVPSEEELLIGLCKGAWAGIRVVRDLAHRTGSSPVW